MGIRAECTVHVLWEKCTEDIRGYLVSIINQRTWTSCLHQVDQSDGRLWHKLYGGHEYMKAQEP